MGGGVLHGPVNVGSQADSLAAAENEARSASGRMGRSWSVDFDPKLIVSEAMEVIERPLSSRPRLLRRAQEIFHPLIYGLRHARDFEVLHLYFRKTLLGYSGSRSGIAHLDLSLWKKLGKALFVTFQGCDVRLKTQRAKQQLSACQDGRCNVARCDASLDERRQRSIEYFVRHCDKLFCLNPDLVPFVPGSEFLPYVNLPPELPRVRKRTARQLPLVVHAPSDRSKKGTEDLLSASQRLQASHPHELRLVEGVPRADALRLYAEADVLVDQLLIGWYGGLAVEAMAQGVPVVAYINSSDLGVLPHAMRSELPIVSAGPDDVDGILAKLLEDSARRESLAERGRRYVERWHHPLRVARRMLELYDDPQLSFWDGYDPDEPLPLEGFSAVKVARRHTTRS